MRRILTAYTGYYNGVRTHLSPDKIRRAIGRFDGSASSLLSRSSAGLYHQYYRDLSFRQGQPMMQTTPRRRRIAAPLCRPATGLSRHWASC